jgi:RND superfamily putative drug exporter
VGASEAIARRAWAVIAAWIIIALAAAPLAAKLNQVVVTEEKGFLPKTAESSRAEEALGSQAGSVQPSAIVVVSNASVSLESYWKLRGPWGSIDWHEANHTSWVDILDSIYSKAFNASLEGVNASVAALRGYLMLWNATLQAKARLEGLSMLINGTASSLAAIDQAYSGYTAAVLGYAKAWPGLLNATQGVARLCQSIPPAYAATLADVARAEYLIENITDAYQKGYMTPEDVEAVVEASNLSEYGIPPLQPGLVVAVFNLTLARGGPSVFTNALAALEAGEILAQSLPEEAGQYAVLLANYTAQASMGGSVPDLRALAAGGPAGLQQLYTVTQSLASSAAPAAALAYGRGMAEAAGQPILYLAVQHEVVDENCSVDLAYEAVAAAIADSLASGERPLPAGMARYIAWLSFNVSQGLTTPDQARQALLAAAVNAVVEAAESRGAPQQIVELLNSTYTVRVVGEWDPNATGVLASNTTAAVLAAAELVSEAMPQVDPQVARLLALGADPGELAVRLVESNPKTPPQAKPLLEAFREKGIPEELSDAINLSLAIIVEQAVAHGMPREAALSAAREAVLVYNGSEGLEDAASKLARSAVEQAWPKVLEKLEGSMISRDHTSFLVILFNSTYNSTMEVKREILEAASKVYPNPSAVATGGVVTSHDMREAALRDVERSDKVSMILVFIILAIVLESVVAVFLPFIGIGLGLSTALGLAYLLATHTSLSLTTISRTVMFSTGLGLGIDYAALISRRFREEMHRLDDKKAAAAAALRASARPIAAGATTAAIGFGSLALAWDFPFLRSIGTSVPLAIALVAAASLTFTPALLAVVGSSRILWWPIGPKARGTGRGARSLGSLAVRGAPALVAVVLVLLAPAVWVHAGFRGSHDLTIMMPEGTESLEGIRIINEKFDPGVVYPIYIVPSSPDKAPAIASAVENLSCVARATVANASSRYVLVIPSVNPLGAEGVDCARSVREAAHRVDAGSLVGGMAAVSLDLEDILNDRFYHRVLPAAVTLMFLSMLAAYGGVVTAIAAVAVVSIAAEYAIALTVAYYQSVRGLPVPWFLPITVFTAILGVGMDYNSFSISRIAEECIRSCRREAVAEGVSRAAILVLGLSLIMASAYGGLMLGSSPHMRMMGVSLSSGVLFAGVLASIALTPPLIALLGRAAWWPWGPRAEVHAEGDEG